MSGAQEQNITWQLTPGSDEKLMQNPEQQRKKKKREKNENKANRFSMSKCQRTRIAADEVLIEETLFILFLPRRAEVAVHSLAAGICGDFCSVFGSGAVCDLHGFDRELVEYS